MTDKPARTIPWRGLGRHVALDNPYFTVYFDDVLLESGKRLGHWVIDYRRRGVGVVPLLADGRALLGLHYRYCPQRWGWEIVSGGVEPGEDVLTAARRELIEETGHSCPLIEPLAQYHPAPGIGNEQFHLYVARGIVPADHPLDRDEIQDLQAFGWEEIEGLIAAGEINDGFTLTGLLRCRTLDWLAG